jgi:transposase
MQSRADIEQEKTQIEAELESVRGTVDKQNRYIQQLEEALILARNARFAAATESFRSLQRERFDEAETLDTESTPSTADDADDADDDVNSIKVPDHQRRRGGRKPLPAELPRIEVVHELSVDERRCTEHDVDLKEIGEKVSEQLEIIPMQIQVIRHIRKQYACPCCEGTLRTAQKPKQPIEKSWASAGLLAYIATAKYADGLPLYRLSGILNRFDIDLDRTTLANWMIRCGQLVQPLINRIEDQLLSHSCLHMDDLGAPLWGKRRFKY